MVWWDLEAVTCPDACLDARINHADHKLTADAVAGVAHDTPALPRICSNPVDRVHTVEVNPDLKKEKRLSEDGALSYGSVGANKTNPTFVTCSHKTESVFVFS